ncbi:type 4b pilus protein PilO2 [bacterium]|nr:type 4b pilus protein PilO2 [bacterium]
MVANKEIKTVDIAGKTYAVGLFWQPVQNEKDYLKEIKVAVQTVVVGANLYCLKKGTAAQYGLGFTSSGQKAGMPAGASGIANALRDKSSAVCVFKVNEGWWFVTIRNNLILAEEDTVYVDEESAKEAFNSMLSIPDWGYKIAPSEWGIEDTKEISAIELLSKAQTVDLKSLKEGGLKNIIILLLLAGAGWYYYHMKQVEKEEMERIERERRMAAAKKKLEAAKPPPPPPPAPYESLADTTDMAKKCTILIVNSTATVPGWDLKDSVCIEKNMKSTWKRGYGTAGWIFEAQRYGNIPKDMVLSADNSAYNNVSGVITIPVIKHTNQTPTLTKEEIQQKLNDIFQSLKLSTFKLNNGKTTVKDPHNPSYIKDYHYTTFSFTDAAYRLPLDWVKLLNEINSVEFTSIKWDNNNRRWTYEGRVYELTPEMIKEQEAAKKKLEEEEKKKQEEAEKKRQEEEKKNSENKETTENGEIKEGIKNDDSK